MSEQEKATELKAVQTKFFTDLDALVRAANDLDGQNAALRFCRSGYEFGRFRRLMPDQLLTTAEEARFRDNFEPGTIAFAAELKGITSMLRAANLYTAKLYLSTFEFIRIDLLQLYEKSMGAKRSANLQKALDTLEGQQNYIHNRMDDWEYDMEYDTADESEKPSLEGIPREHKWWNKELGITSSDKEVPHDSDSDSDWTK
jgi:hypothetical protein